VNLFDLRSEVLAHEINPSVARVNSFLNEALRVIARQIDFYSEEASEAFSTVSGTSTYAWPTDLGRVRYLRNVDDTTTLGVVRLRDLDVLPLSRGQPVCYAADGSNLTLWPTPDGVYDLSLRYWALPDLMVNDSDIPAIPEDYHRLLTYYALDRCYASEDDPQMAQYWAGLWSSALGDMKVDVKFPSSDGPRRVQSMWDQSGSVPRYVIP
jgi:hypothetical protein